MENSAKLSKIIEELRAAINKQTEARLELLIKELQLLTTDVVNGGADVKDIQSLKNLMHNLVDEAFKQK